MINGREIKFRGLTVNGDMVIGSLSVITKRVGVANP